jgi:integrase
VKANSASGSLNKWLGVRVPDGCVMHSFRHSFRDRLRAAQCPSDIIDALGGWSTAGVGSSYGDGFELSQKAPWMMKLNQLGKEHVEMSSQAP